jgi:transposase-like protein
VVTERARFVLEAEQSFLSFAALCRRHGISRPTGHKWLRRYREQGLEGLEDRSHRPHSCPHATPASVVERILEVRRQRGWGAPKIRHKLEDEISQVPSVDAIHRVLQRHGLIEHRVRSGDGDPHGADQHHARVAARVRGHLPGGGPALSRRSPGATGGEGIAAAAPPA